ncbi:hypothetical protein [Streptomyces liangshanensis]|uniref:Uncharacterized protein n=1 Tax=Streptomyces liangshanensis TaxID=2717324 RepID=A0A6G9H525_9ACTN|nr:hypothetical protein [Streptomyces liangshanensis]QIQ05625.1 hypothetical protein HA039_27980 [Streptomyces liangshanensis]
MSAMSEMSELSMVGPVLFKAACPECRARFELSAGALRLAIGASRRTTFYSFVCPECEAAVRKPAGERIVELLTRGGVRTLRLAAAVPEPGGPGPALPREPAPTS